jgi:adenosine deaminase
MHPLPIILNQGIPVVLSSDDPTMFNSMGLSYDFFQVTFSLFVPYWNQTHQSLTGTGSK